MRCRPSRDRGGGPGACPDPPGVRTAPRLPHSAAVCSATPPEAPGAPRGIAPSAAPCKTASRIARTRSSTPRRLAAGERTAAGRPSPDEAVIFPVASLKRASPEAPFLRRREGPRLRGERHGGPVLTMLMTRSSNPPGPREVVLRDGRADVADTSSRGMSPSRTVSRGVRLASRVSGRGGAPPLAPGALSSGSVDRPTAGYPVLVPPGQIFDLGPSPLVGS